MLEDRSPSDVGHAADSDDEILLASPLAKAAVLLVSLLFVRPPLFTTCPPPVLVEGEPLPRSRAGIAARSPCWFPPIIRYATPMAATTTKVATNGRSLRATGILDVFLIPGGLDEDVSSRGTIVGRLSGAVALAAWREGVAARIAVANGSTCDKGSHWAMPSHQQIVLPLSRPVRQNSMICSAANGPAGCLPSAGMYHEED
jgi:hypothetical protein